MVVSGRLTRRAWARLELRARRAHERDLLRILQELGSQEPPVVAIDLPRRGRCIIRITLIDRQVVLAGVSERALSIAAGLAGSRSDLALVDGGRYRDGWWLTLRDGATLHHILGVYLHIVPQGRPGSATPTEHGPRVQEMSLTGAHGG